MALCTEAWGSVRSTVLVLSSSPSLTTVYQKLIMDHSAAVLSSSPSLSLSIKQHRTGSNSCSISLEFRVRALTDFSSFDSNSKTDSKFENQLSF